ncbi:YjfB family protein [Pseudomonas sp. ML96]|uniref:YjfB family protein n=1 Tax=Pseudomonas sp. ML96 TaxID=1523503 RepID=UPI0005B7C332|nr:YjfB family protein [Pseudomonas sp. ML96]
MELSNIASAVSNANATQAAAQASLLILSKTLDLQAESAIGLIQAIPQVTPPSNPPNLGNSIDVMA